MQEKLFILFSMVCLALGSASCSPVLPDAGPQPSPILRDPSTLPPDLAVQAVQKFSRTPGMGNIQNFGSAIALGPDVLAVGAPDWGNQSGKQEGRAFIYRREGSSWVEDATLAANDRLDGKQYDGHFGSDVVLEGDTLFVGAPDADDPQAGDNTGAVYRFQRGPDGWQEAQRLAASQPIAGARFGYRMAISGDTLAAADGTGATIYIFQQAAGGWAQRAFLEIPKVEGFEGYGMDLALFGDTVATAYYYRQGEGDQSKGFSRIYFFERANGSWEKGALPVLRGVRWRPMGAIRRRFIPGRQRSFGGQPGCRSGGFRIGFYVGGGVDLPPGFLRLEAGRYPDRRGRNGYERIWQQHHPEGQPLAGGGGNGERGRISDGVAYLFTFYQGRWVDQLRLTPSDDGGLGDFFGSHVAMVNDTLLIAAPNEFGNAVYVYEVGVK